MFRETQLLHEGEIPYIVENLEREKPLTEASRLVRGFVRIPVSQEMPNFRSIGRSVCTVSVTLSHTTLLGAHYIPGYDMVQEAVIHDTFQDEDGPKFGVVVTSEPLDSPSLQALAETMAYVSQGRQPDIVSIPVWQYPPDDLPYVEARLFQQLVHTVTGENGVLVHSFEVPGTAYTRSGTLEELALSDPVGISA